MEYGSINCLLCCCSDCYWIALIGFLAGLEGVLAEVIAYCCCHELA